MIKKYFTLLLIFSSIYIYGQGEANNWYFGYGAGIHFEPDGSVTSLPNSQVNTSEGCSTISNAAGVMLFYTDGRTVWDRNHVKMPNGNYANGTGLFGNYSSTQSALIVPKPGNPNVYYIFTTDEPHGRNATEYPYQNTEFPGFEDDGYNNGFNYSVVDLSVTGANGSIGDVISRNNHLITYDTNPNGDEIKFKCSEKVTAVKDSSGNYWVITHFMNRFYAYKVTSAGVSSTPVISTIPSAIPSLGYRMNNYGYMKVSPNGKKLVSANSFFIPSPVPEIFPFPVICLYDFNSNTGVVSNMNILMEEPEFTTSFKLVYGAEFSAESKKLYISSSSVMGAAQHLWQFDMESTNIPASIVHISALSNSGALQIGPNKKIYLANKNQNSLGVINNPEETGALCNFVNESVFLDYGISAIGLPSFITTIFSTNFLAEHFCLGDTTTFTLPPALVNQAPTVSWDFGDGSPVSNVMEPTHVYTAPGNYEVTLTITLLGSPTVITQTITIYEVPVAHPVGNQNLCDTDTDGIMQIDLQQLNNTVLGGQDPAVFEVKYFTSIADANSNTNAINGTSFTNTTPTFTLFVRVNNRNNSACHAITSFNVKVAQKPVITDLSDYNLCDDNTANGIQTFNLLSKVAGILGTQSPTDFEVSFHLNQADADTKSNVLPGTYTNTVASEQPIFVRVENKSSTTCYVTGSFYLRVIPLPTALPTTLVQCDYGLIPDGLTTFNLAEAIAAITNGNTNLTTAFYLNATDAQNNTNPQSTVFFNTTNPQTLSVRVTDNSTGCYAIVPLELEVTLTPTQQYELDKCSANGFASFTLTDLGLENVNNVVRYYSTVLDALLEQNELTPVFTNTVANTQIIYVRIESNNDCDGLHEIKLNVKPTPPLSPDATQPLCAGTTAVLSSGVTDTSRYDFLWSTGATTPTITVNTAGTYTIKVTDKTSGCSATRTITVVASAIATITDVEVHDLSDNNTITVHVTGTSNHYVYSLYPEGPFQDSNVFENVAAGVYTVYVKDFYGCGTVKKTIAVLGIPKYFTPNGDGYHELWRIKGAATGPYRNSIVNIFDRYGKLLHQMRAWEGWNGIYNNQPLPSTDYWYLINLTDGRVVKGHFTLKR